MIENLNILIRLYMTLFKIPQISEIEVKFDQIETESARLRFQMQETEAQRDKLAEMRKEFERAEDRYSQDIERLTERLQNVQFQYEKAKTEKEKIELQSLKLTRDLERTTLDLDELRAQRGIEESTNLEERKGNKYSNTLCK